LLVGTQINLILDLRLVKRMPIVNTWHTTKAMVDTTRKVMKIKIGLSLLQRKLRISQIHINPSSLNAENNLIVIESGRSSRFVA